VTAPSYTPVDAVDGLRASSVQFVEASLRDASARLEGDASVADVEAAERAIDEAERSLGLLAMDPWEPTQRPLREARELLSSSLLAAALCAGDDVAVPITARLLRRGADSARRVLSSPTSSTGLESQR
jgi:hypothetical protein